MAVHKQVLRRSEILTVYIELEDAIVMAIRDAKADSKIQIVLGGAVGRETPPISLSHAARQRLMFDAR